MNRENRSTLDFIAMENVVFLKKTSLFSSMRTHDLGALAAVAEVLNFRKGEDIVCENDVGDSLYLLKEGRVRIWKKIDENSSIDLASLEAGACFGDMAVFDSEQRSASVSAQSECTLLRITGDDLMDVILDNPYIAIEMLKIFIARLRAANSTIKELSTRQAERGPAANGISKE